MALDKKIGNFECGKEFDALIVDPDVQGSPMNIFKQDTALEVVEKFLYTGRYSVIKHNSLNDALKKAETIRYFYCILILLHELMLNL